MFRHIVVGCDGSPAASDSVGLGATIARVTGARLSLVGVFGSSLLPVTGVSDRKTLREELRRRLRLERDLRAPEALIHTVADDSVGRALRHHAERWHADLVVLGSSRTAALGHVAVGRYGRQLLDEWPFSLCVAARGLHATGSRLEAIGAGYDGGPEAGAALGLAAELCRASGARLIVRRVVEDRLPSLTPEEWMATKVWSHDRMWAGARLNALAATRAAAARLTVPFEVSVSVGAPGDEMRALSDAVDLVVIGSRRWGPLARRVNGGVGETLVADAGCSILIAQSPQVARRRRSGQRESTAAVI